MPTRLESPAKSGPAVVLKTSCAVCGSGRLEKVLDLPDFPLTGIYTETFCPGRYPNFDQALLLCEVCGHAQLLHAIDPGYLYVDTYSHRSSASAIATEGNDFFAAFLRGVAGGWTFKAALEVGCNDLYLFRKLETLCGCYVGIDPIWKGQVPAADPKLSVIGKFIEEVDLEKEIAVRPDLVISAHTFEHLENPRKHLEALFRFAADGALFVIEVPGFESLLRMSRFDQVFHQHVQYFSLASFRYLIEELGGRYLAHTFNYGYWNGTLLVAFCKGEGVWGREEFTPAARKPDPGEIQRRYRQFKERMARAADLMRELDEPLYGYGAAQMVPTLAYHLKSDLGSLECILDDDPRREGLCYPDLKVRIQRPGPEIPWSSASFMITALDSTRPILRRLMTLKPKTVFVPLELL